MLMRARCLRPIQSFLCISDGEQTDAAGVVVLRRPLYDQSVDCDATSEASL